MTEHIDGAGHLGQQCGIAITVTGHHLPNSHALRIASQGGRANPAFKGHLLACDGNSVEMIVKPDRVKTQRFSFLSDAGHRFIGLYRIGDARQVHAPALRNNDAIIHCVTSSCGSSSSPCCHYTAV